MIPEPVAVGVLADQDEVAQVVARYNLLAVPVVDDDGRLAGIVTVDDAMDIDPPDGLEEASAAPLRPGLTGLADVPIRRRRQPGRAATRRHRRRAWQPRSRPVRGRATCCACAGRFRGRRGLLAFLAVMGPGLVAGMAGNDAGGITTYTVVGAAHRPSAAVAVPGHGRDPGDRPGNGGPPGRGDGPGPVRPHPRPVRGSLDSVRDGRPAGRQRRPDDRRVRRDPGRRRGGRAAAP